MFNSLHFVILKELKAKHEFQMGGIAANCSVLQWIAELCS